MTAILKKSFVTGNGQLRLKNCIHQSGLSQSVGEAVRKVKEGAVFINEVRITDSEASVSPPFDLRVGRNARRVENF